MPNSFTITVIKNKVFTIVKKIARWLFFYFIIIMFSSLPIINGWENTYHEALLIDLFLALILNAITVILVGTTIGIILRKINLTGLLSAIIVMIFFNQGYNYRLEIVYDFFVKTKLEKYTNETTLSLILIFLIILLSLGLSWSFEKYLTKRSKNIYNLYKIISYIIIFAFIVQSGKILIKIIPGWQQYFYRPPELGLNLENNEDVLPDIYYIVLDRYTNNNVLIEQFGYDNSIFINFLEKNNFFIKNDAYSSYPYTAMSISSTLNANYHTDLIKKFKNLSYPSLEPYHHTARYSPVIKELKNKGYSYYLLGSWYETTNTSNLTNDFYQPMFQLIIRNRNITLNSFFYSELQKTIYWQFIKKGIQFNSESLIHISELNTGRTTVLQLNRLMEIASSPAGGRFIFAHFMSPHEPYFLNADGSWATNPTSDNIGKSIKEKYIGQVQYINNQIQQIILQILTTSNGNAIIILQSDEGPYPFQMNAEQFDQKVVKNILNNQDMTKWSEKDLKQKFGILAAYYLPDITNEQLELGTDSVNIFRLIFNNYFGESMEYLPRCSYALIEGRSKPYNYSNITNLLTGVYNKDCLID